MRGEEGRNGVVVMGPIGVDLDNTIVCYDDGFYRTAMELGLVGPDVGRGKKAIRDAIREIPNGEIEWQKLQAEIYGPRMDQAQIIDGVEIFCRECVRRSLRIYIISHKTEFAHYDPTRTNLRTAAMNWMDAHGFFASDGFGLQRDSVFFESTREAKIERIRSLRCSHFIDDLEETFLEETFPNEVHRILFDPYGHYGPRPGMTVCSSWGEITHHLFDDAS